MNIEQAKYVAYGMRMVAVAQFATIGFKFWKIDWVLFVGSAALYALMEWKAYNVLGKWGGTENG